MSPIEAAAHREALRAPLPDVAGRLQAALGQRLVAYATGTGSPQAVGRWAAGTNTPRDDAERRLRDLFRIYLILRETDEDRTIRAWLIGANPELQNEPPLEVLRDSDTAAAVIAAAEAFAA